MRVILASSSPRRKELLGLLGVQPEIIVPDIKENFESGESIDSFIKRVTILKGKSIYKNEYYNSLVISSDTIVFINNSIIGKPVDREDAFEILKALSDNAHDVITGVSLFYQGKNYFDLCKTRVYFSKISDKEINFYLDNEDYLDKAGAYGIQGKASAFIKGIEGCFFNVVGFPVNLFYTMLKGIGIKWETISG